ncbi:T7SS effector LXG polymorphic toxin [Metabacillus endolithicus]|uniref:T7SS effector LXG polymorphic toxin n=1 Tax=Metabacillus endolithicus TaxID=1535204 RepID=A0ABW5C0D7_9BACI|nr:T7SS effector LXG polymorphic toxin [Metabacillus endolithicus]UPG64030.1 T7SS effector LXG polymorphic toxin [Metabacillus endolithicus]
MRVLDSQSLVDTMEKRSNDYEKLRSQLESLQKTFQALVELDSFTGKGADAIKGFYKAHTEVMDAWFQLIDCQIAFFNGVNYKLISDKLGAETIVHSSFLEDNLSKSERQAEDMVDQHRSELNSIFQKINDILSLQVFSTSDFQAYMDDSRVKRQKTIEAVERVDQELLNEYMYSMYEQDNAQSLYQALKDATSTGVKIQPINFNAEAFRTSEIYQLQAGAKFHTDNYLRLKNKELEEQGIQTNTLYEGNWNNDEFNVAEFSGYNDLLRAIYGFDPVTGSQLSKDERLNYTMLLYMRYGLLKVSPEKVEKKENEELNFFDKSLNSFKEIGQDVWHGLETRADKMFDSPYDFTNYLTLGGLDGAKVTWEGAKLRYNNSTDSFYDFLNYLTFGSADIINGTFNPEDPLSKEHWLNSLGVFTLAGGGASSVLLKNRPKINGSIEGKRKGNEDGVEGTGKSKNISPSEIARSWQGQGAYPGIDKYRDITLKKGTVIYRGEPFGSEYFTTSRAIQRSGNDATVLFEGLQVQKHPQFGYRPGMTAYVVDDDLTAAFGITKANPHYGPGNLPQMFVPDANELIEQGILKPIHSQRLTNFN